MGRWGGGEWTNEVGEKQIMTSFDYVQPKSPENFHIYVPQISIIESYFPRQQYWSGLPFPSPWDLPHPGIVPASPALAGTFFTTEQPGKPTVTLAALNVDVLRKDLSAYLHQPVINRKLPKPSRNLFSCADITLPLTILFQILICQHRLWKVNWSCRFSSAPTSNNSTMPTCFHPDVGLPISASLGSHYFHWVPRLQ